MENFIAYNPTKLHFGKGVVKDLGDAAASLGTKAMLVYGKGSVLRNGSYADTKKQLEKAGIEIIEYNGIKPNPVVEAVDEAAEIGRIEKVDLVVAVGGGSVIDSAKVLTICIADGVKAWDVMKGKHAPKAAVPLISVLTLAATGTEMNGVAVLQNHETDEKIGFRNVLMFPDHSFLDPSYTLSVPSSYTAYGIADLIAHCLEAWFGRGNAPLSDRFVVSIIKEAMDIGPKLMTDLENYEYRERIMWAATNALNDTTIHGRVTGDWGLHGLGHVFSYLYDTAHGATLTLLYPAWMKQIGKEHPERVIELGKALFAVETVEETAENFKSLFKKIGSPVKAQEVNLSEEHMDEILDLMKRREVSGTNYSMDQEDRKSIVEMTFQ